MKYLEFLVPTPTLVNDEPTGYGLWSCLQVDPRRPLRRRGFWLWRLVKLSAFVAVIYYVMR
jgi:hypothetical protein